MRITIDEEHQLQQKGVLDKGVPMPFNVKGGIEATADGRLRMHAAKVKGLGVPVNPLMKLLSIEMDDLVKVKPGHGVTVDGNDLILDPQQLLPPPLIRGKVTSVRVDDAVIVLSFGSGRPRQAVAPAVSKHYIYWRGGELQFGKLLMTNTDLELVDEDADDPFDFSVEHWNDQLVAGYSKTTAEPRPEGPHARLQRSQAATSRHTLGCARGRRRRPGKPGGIHRRVGAHVGQLDGVAAIEPRDGPFERHFHACHLTVVGVVHLRGDAAHG